MADTPGYVTSMSSGLGCVILAITYLDLYRLQQRCDLGLWYVRCRYLCVASPSDSL